MEDTKILIVEDEKKIADTLRLGLIENGYAAEVAYDANNAYRLFLEYRFTLMLLDINLPGVNGLDLCKKIRRKDDSLLVIMLTSMNTLADKIYGYDAGADDYLVKPFEFKELLLKIKALVRRTTTQPAESILRAADLEMNLDSKEVTRDNKRVNLTAKEFQLLEYLLRNQNKVVSRSDIAVNVWDIDFDTNTNIIDVYISYLRNKIDKEFSPRLIHTQVGMGYILKAKEN